MASEQSPPRPPRFNVNDLLAPVQSTRLRNLPRLVAGAIKLVWAAGRGYLVLTLLLQLLSGIAMATEVFVARSVLASFIRISNGNSTNHIVLPLVLFAIATAVMAACTTASAEIQRVLGELVSRHAMGKVLDVAVAADLLAFETPQFHDRLQRANVNASYRPLQMTTGVLSIAQGLFGALGVGAALIVIQPLFLVLLVAAYIPVWVANQRAGAASYKNFVEITERDRRRAYLQYVLTRKEEAKEVRTFDLGAFFRGRWDDLYDWRVTRIRQLARKRMVLGVVGNGAMSVLTAGAVGLLVWLVSTHRMSLAGAGAAAGALLLIGNQLQSLSSGAGQLFESSLFIEDFNSFVRSMPAMVAHGKGGGGVPPERFAVLRAEGVQFTYPSREQPSLLAADIEIKEGEVVALVGENGSGKTTLAKVLGGLYRPTGGRVTWDGRDAAEFDPHLWRDRVAVLFQDFVRYQLSARDNIGAGRWGRFDDIEGIHDAAGRSGAEPVISRLPEGYDTYLGPEFLGGVDLSGGEWQRVALARAFFRDAPFVILDEPTAALDPRSEAELFANIRSLFAGRSTLLISHRFSSVRSADRIYVLSAGRVIESGTHDELMALGGHYSELFTLQANAFLGGSPAQPDRLD